MPLVIQCANTMCPYDGHVDKIGELCAGCKADAQKYENSYNSLTDEKQERREQWSRHNRKGKK